MALAQQERAQFGHTRGFLAAGLRIAVVRHGHVADAVRGQFAAGRLVEQQAVGRGGRRRAQPAVVDGFGNETADLRMHAVRGVQENALRRRDGGLAVEQVLQR